VRLTEFLLARIAEDEAVAQEATWQSEHYSVFSYLWAEDGRHVARHNPARVLAECEAKRRIVESYLAERSRRDIYQSAESRAVEDDGTDLMGQAQARRASAAGCRGLEIAVEALSLPYADHPDYDEEWKP